MKKGKVWSLVVFCYSGVFVAWVVCLSVIKPAPESTWGQIALISTPLLVVVGLVLVVVFQSKNKPVVDNRKVFWIGDVQAWKLARSKGETEDDLPTWLEKGKPTQTN